MAAIGAPPGAGSRAHLGFGPQEVHRNVNRSDRYRTPAAVRGGGPRNATGGDVVWDSIAVSKFCEVGEAPASGTNASVWPNGAVPIANRFSTPRSTSRDRPSARRRIVSAGGAPTITAGRSRPIRSTGRSALTVRGSGEPAIQITGGSTGRNIPPPSSAIVSNNGFVTGAPSSA